jgi:hypothetical protein
LLSRISGADAPALTSAIKSHSKPISPLSQTSLKPAPPPATDNEKVAIVEEETEEKLNSRLKKLMNMDKVVLFMKGSPDSPRCGFSRKTVALLREQKVEFSHFDILEDESVRQGMSLSQTVSESGVLIVGHYR